MRALGIGSSPEKGGITDILLDKALEGARSESALTEKIILNDLDFKPCQECGGCGKTGACSLHDDMRIVYKAFDSAGALIIASPVFFGSVSAQLKMMIDRFHCIWVAKYVLKNRPVRKMPQKGVFLCAAGQDKKEYFENSKEIVKIFFKVQGIEYFGGLFFGGYNVKSTDTEEKEVFLRRAFELGASLVKSFC